MSEQAYAGGMCQCGHYVNCHVNGEGRCRFAELQAAYGYRDPHCPCEVVVKRNVCPHCLHDWKGTYCTHTVETGLMPPHPYLDFCGCKNKWHNERVG